MGAVDQVLERRRNQAASEQAVMPFLATIGKTEYRAFAAPVNERREWLYILTRSGGYEVLRYELMNKMLFSPDGSQLALIYVDAVYLLKGKKLVTLLPLLTDRQVEFLDEYDARRHYPFQGDSCFIQSVESFARNSSQSQQIVDQLQTSKQADDR